MDYKGLHRHLSIILQDQLTSKGMDLHELVVFFNLKNDFGIGKLTDGLYVSTPAD